MRDPVMMIGFGLEESLAFFKFLIDTKLVDSLDDAISRRISIDTEHTRTNKQQDLLFSIDIDGKHHPILYKRICVDYSDPLVKIVHKYQLLKL